MKKEAAYSSEMSVSTHKATQCQNSGDRKLDNPHHENLKKLVTQYNQLLCLKYNRGQVIR